MVLARTRAVVLAALLGAAGAAAAASTGRVPIKQAPQPIDPAAYTVRATSTADLRMEEPALPDLSGYTSAAIAAKISAHSLGKVSTRRMVESPALHEFIAGHDGRAAEWAKRQSTNPLALFIDGGYLSVRGLCGQTEKRYCEETSPGVFVLRLPLVVGQDSTLHVDSTVKELRLSQDGGAFLVNDGQLFITDTRVTGWREYANKPAKFEKATEFRPFIISWGGSRLYIAHSVVSSLGYDQTKSYGISISQYSPHEDNQLHRPRPSGWIVDSEFYDNWYGFYCYEADDVVVLRNQFHDNVIYGVDPHDRSRHLIIAWNKCWGGSQKHGIILSREVNDSFIFRNRTFGNHLAGIVLDRQSSNNVIAYNDTYGNYGDGITVYESSDNILWSNRAIGNARHGIRLRNSVDIRLYGNYAVGNGLTGIYGHTKDLTGSDRDLKLDPFELKVSMVIVGGKLMFNRSAPVNVDQPLSLEMYDVEMLAPAKEAGIVLPGVLGYHQRELLDILVRQHGAALVVPAGGGEPERRNHPVTAAALPVAAARDD